MPYIKNINTPLFLGALVVVSAVEGLCAEPTALAEALALAGASGAWLQAPPLAPRAVPAKPPYRPQALKSVIDRVDAGVRAGGSPVVVFDIDDTLFDSSYRDLRILKELSASQEFRRSFPGEAAVISKVRLEDSRGRYNVLDVAGALGVTGQPALDAIKSYWLPRFFSDDYVLADQPIAGGARYVRELVREGAVVVYLTGRGHRTMRRGTEASLKKNGFPMPDGNKVLLIMKEDKNEKDAVYKERVLTEVVDKQGTVVASFENEPKNLNVFARRYPGAALIFLDTKRSPAPDQPDPSAAWVKNFNR